MDVDKVKDVQKCCGIGRHYCSIKSFHGKQKADSVFLFHAFEMGLFWILPTVLKEAKVTGNPTIEKAWKFS